MIIYTAVFKEKILFALALSSITDLLGQNGFIPDESSEEKVTPLLDAVMAQPDIIVKEGIAGEAPIIPETSLLWKRAAGGIFPEMTVRIGVQKTID